jgi:hypothetical protein
VTDAEQDQEPVMGGSRRGLVAVAVGAVGISLLAAGTAAAKPVRATGARIVSAPKAVGTVLSVSSTDIWIKHAAGGALTTLAKGDTVYVQDIIAAGPGVVATLKLSLPPGLPRATIDLLDFYKQLSPTKPAASAVVKEFFVAPGTVSADHTLKITRSGMFITLTLSP